MRFNNTRPLLKPCALSLALAMTAPAALAQSSTSPSSGSSASDSSSSRASTEQSSTRSSDDRPASESDRNSREYGTTGSRSTGTTGSQSQTSGRQPSKPGGEASKQELRVRNERLEQDVTDANKASKIIGMEVKNMQNEDLGKISELVIDVDSGKVAYAVLSSGGVLGMGDRLIAVPFEALTLREGEKTFVIDAEKQRLEQASGFSDENWPSISEVQKSTVGLSPTGRSSSEQRELQEQRQEQREKRYERQEERKEQSPQKRSSSPY